MYLDKDTVLRRANAFGVPRQWTPITDRALRDWVEEGLVPGPTGRGRGRKQGKAQDWPPLAYRRVLQLSRLKQQGVTRHSAQIVTLWLSGAYFPHERLHDAIVSEYARLRKKAWRSIPIGWDATVNPVPRTPRKRQAVERVLGLESLHAALDSAAMDALVALVAGGLSGEPPRLDPAQTSEVMLAPLGLSDMTMKDEFVRFAANDENPIGDAIAGLLANPEEMERPGQAAEEMIAHANEELLRNVRDYTGVWPWIVSSMTPILALAIPEITADTFRAVLSGTGPLNDLERRLTLFGYFLRQAALKDDKGRGMGEAARVAIPMVRHQGVANLYAQVKEQIEEQKDDT